MAYIKLLFLSLVVQFVCGSETQPRGKLIFANVLYRHGDRTPSEPYPNDPWSDPSHWTHSWGELTNFGKEQHFQLGTFLRKRYGNLITHKYNNKEAYIRSTDVDRTILSAMSNLAGLYPSLNGTMEIWHKESDHQFVPVHTIPEHLDSVLAAKKHCPNLEEEQKRIRNTEQWQNMNKENADLYNYLSEKTGKLVNSIEDVANLYKCLFIQEVHNKTLPPWTKQVYPHKMKPISEFGFSTQTYTPILKKLKTGPLLKEMLLHFVNKSQGILSPDRSLWVYSAHDTTVANLLNTLGVFSHHIPPYSSCVMLELWKFEDQHNVQVFYRNSTTAEPQLMSLPQCGTMCPLEKMLSIYEPVLPVDWEAECKLKADSKIGILLWIVMGLSIVVALSIPCTLYLQKRLYKLRQDKFRQDYIEII